MKHALFGLLATFTCAVAGPPAHPPATPAPFQEPTVDPLNLTDAEAIALRQSPTISEAQFQALAANQVVRQVRSAFFPQIMAEAAAVGDASKISSRLGQSAGSNDSERIGASGGLANPTVLNRQSDGIIFSQLVTDFGRTWDLTAASKKQALSQAQRSLLIHARVLLRVDQVYFSALEAQAVLEVANETVHARQIFADQVVALSKSQLKSELDVSFANVALQEGKLLQLEAQNRVATSFADLSNVLGYRMPRRFALVNEPQFPGPRANLAALITQALELRPEVASLRYERDAANRIVGADRAAHFPRVSIIGAAGRTPDGDPTTVGNYGSVGVIVDVPIFTGFRLTARDEESRLRAQAAAQSVREMEDLVAKDVEVALLNTMTAFDKIGVTASLLASATEANNLAEAKYRIGTTSIVEFVQAQLAMLQAQIDHASATYEYQIQRLTLDFQIGAPRFLAGLPSTPSRERPIRVKERAKRGK